MDSHNSTKSGWATCSEGHTIYAFDSTMVNRVNNPDLPCYACEPDKKAPDGWVRKRVLVATITVEAWVQGGPPIGLLIMNDGEPMLEGQYHSYYHSKEGIKARLKAVDVATKSGGCWPWCGGPCCATIRKWLEDNKEYYQGTSKC